MASYDVPSSVVLAALANSTISPETTREIIKVLNENTSGTVQINAYPDGVVTGNDLNGANIAVVAGGKVYLIRASNAYMAALDLILFTGDHQGSARAMSVDKVVFEDTVTINNNNFDGVIVLGDANGKVQVSTNKGTTVETGAGDDWVATGRGNDSVTVVAGIDTVKTGGGNDKVWITDTYISESSIIDGGGGKNQLDLSAVHVNSITGSAGKLVIGLDNGGSLTASHFQSIILSDADISASRVALNVITGIGDDLLNLGRGADSVKIAGGIDSMNTGAGNDKLTFNDNFIGKAFIDGGEGNRDRLDLSNLDIISATTDTSGVHFTLLNGSTIDATNIELFVYDTNGSEKGGVQIVGVEEIVPLINV